MKKWIIGIVAFLMCNNNVQAAADVYGSTGIIGTPTADVVREGQFYLGYYRWEEADSISFGTNLTKNWEISIASFDAERNERTTYVNMKYALRQENVLLPGIAIGVEDIMDETDRTAFVAMSKALPFGIRLHAGYGNGRYDGLFYAVEKQLLSSLIPGTFPDTSLMVEHDGEDLNYGLRMSLAEGLKFNVGRHHDETYFGLTYNFY